jgi:hypothetical protein
VCADWPALLAHLKSKIKTRDFQSREEIWSSEFQLKERTEEATEALKAISKCWKAFQKSSTSRDDHPFLAVITGTKSNEVKTNILLGRIWSRKNALWI